MAETENLAIVIDVIDSFSTELNQLLFKLGEVEVALQSVDDHTIDVDVRDSDVDALMAKLAAVGAMGLAAGGGPGGGGGAAGGGAGAAGARGVAKAADDLEEGFRLTSLRMSDVHNALARIVPLLAVLIGALPAAIGGLVALGAAAIGAAGALATLGAFAAAGAALERGGGDAMAGFSDMLEEIQSDFMDAFRPIMEQLAPLFEDALDGLDRLFQSIANQSDAFLQLRDDARAFGAWMLDVLPSVLREFSQFVDAAGPALGAVVDALSDIDVFGILAGVLSDTLPMLIRFGANVANIIPHLYRMSLSFLRVANAILAAAGAFLDIITLGGVLDKELGLLVGGFLAVYGAVLLFNSALLTAAFNGLVTLGSYLVTFIVQLVGAKAAMVTSTVAVYGLRTAMLALAGAIAVTGIGALLVLVGGLGSVFMGTSNKIDKATESLKEFEKQRSSMNQRESNPYANPEVARGQATGRSRFAGSSVSVTVEGDADEDTVRKQSHNAMYRMERSQR